MIPNTKSVVAMNPNVSDKPVREDIVENSNIQWIGNSTPPNTTVIPLHRNRFEDDICTYLLFNKKPPTTSVSGSRSIRV